MREDPRSAPFAEVVATVQAQVQLLKEIMQGETFLNGTDIVDRDHNIISVRCKIITVKVKKERQHRADGQGALNPAWHIP
jgi:hypothetical protein